MAVVEIPVAALDRPFGGVFETPWPSEIAARNVQWVDRPRTVVRVEDDSTVRAVLVQAAEQVGVRLGPSPSASWDWLYFVDLYRPSDDIYGYDRSYLRGIPLVDDEGHAYWGTAALDATLAQLERAATYGAVEGAPRRLYLILLFPQGTGLAADWQATLTTLRQAFDVLVQLGAAYGGLLALQAIGKTCRRGVDALRRNSPRWVEKSGSPRDVLALAARVPRTTEEVALLLDCSTDDAEAILALLGFEAQSDGRWRRSSRAGARLLTENAQLAVEAPSLSHRSPSGERVLLSEDELALVLRHRADSLARTGDVPDLDWSPISRDATRRPDRPVLWRRRTEPAWWR